MWLRDAVAEAIATPEALVVLDRPVPARRPGRLLHLLAEVLGAVVVGASAPARRRLWLRDVVAEAIAAPEALVILGRPVPTRQPPRLLHLLAVVLGAVVLGASVAARGHMSLRDVVAEAMPPQKRSSSSAAP
jgi:hypothetical protein